jgi:hypothetical protein
MTHDMRDTQKLPAIETIADLHARDPENVYSHRRANDSTVAYTDQLGIRHEIKWTAAGLNALLADVMSGGEL